MFKRIFDIIVSFIALIILFPVLMFVSYKVAINLGRPLLFRQKRPGLRGKVFEIIKFRSMLNGLDEDGNVLPDSKRLTPFGQYLRSTSLDELPALWNVLVGDMSLVGPRPLLVDYLPLYSPEQARRHEIRPGITGWAQVNGRNAISWEDKFKYDVWYVDNNNFWLDLKIILLTLRKVFIREGISADDHPTMPFFIGEKDSGVKKIEK